MKEVLPGWLMADILQAKKFDKTNRILAGFDEKGNCVVDYELPPGSWEIVGIVTEVSEEGMIDVARSNGFEPDRTLLMRKK